MVSDNDDSKTEAVAEKRSSWLRRSFYPFRIATLRGLGVILPPLLTIMLFVWAWNTIDRAILRPVESLASHCLAWSVEDIRDDATINAELNSSPDLAETRFTTVGDQRVYTADDGTELIQVNEQWLPLEVFDFVKTAPGDASLTTAHDYYRRYVQLRFLKRHLVIPAVLAIVLALMYLTGKLFAVGIGRIFWAWFESLINRVPIIRNVYSSVKQVTDFAFSENEIEFTRVVAVEYPRKGIWSIGFVTGESFADIRKAVGEPMLSVLMPTSPMPATGFTITVRKSETIELDISIDQAIQFCVSCGVVLPGLPPAQASRAAIEGQVRNQAAATNPLAGLTPSNNGPEKSSDAIEKSDAVAEDLSSRRDRDEEE